MDHIHLINTIRSWERRLEIESEKQKNSQISSYSDSLAELQRLHKESKAIFARINKPKRDHQPVCCGYTQESYLETQKG